jgi:chromosomal replication initiation ATPase DnaA|nr:MAG TPA: hypothetical protein [Caudoviricetes sp.]
MEENKLIKDITTAVGRIFRVSPEDIKGHGKARVLTDARYLAMYMAREKGEYTFRIAEFFGVSSQAVCVGINRTAERLKLYASLRDRHDWASQLLDNCL